MTDETPTPLRPVEVGQTLYMVVNATPRRYEDDDRADYTIHTAVVEKVGPKTVTFKESGSYRSRYYRLATERPGPVVSTHRGAAGGYGGQLWYETLDDALDVIDARLTERVEKQQITVRNAQATAERELAEREGALVGFRAFRSSLDVLNSDDA